MTLDYWILEGGIDTIARPSLLCKLSVSLGIFGFDVMNGFESPLFSIRITRWLLLSLRDGRGTFLRLRERAAIYLNSHRWGVVG